MHLGENYITEIMTRNEDVEIVFHRVSVMLQDLVPHTNGFVMCY